MPIRQMYRENVLPSTQMLWFSQRRRKKVMITMEHFQDGWARTTFPSFLYPMWMRYCCRWWFRVLVIPTDTPHQLITFGRKCSQLSSILEVLKITRKSRHQAVHFGHCEELLLTIPAQRVSTSTTFHWKFLFLICLRIWLPWLFPTFVRRRSHLQLMPVNKSLICVKWSTETWVRVEKRHINFKFRLKLESYSFHLRVIATENFLACVNSVHNSSYSILFDVKRLLSARLTRKLH